MGVNIVQPSNTENLAKIAINHIRKGLMLGAKKCYDEFRLSLIIPEEFEIFGWVINCDIPSYSFNIEVDNESVILKNDVLKISDIQTAYEKFVLDLANHNILNVSNRLNDLSKIAERNVFLDVERYVNTIKDDITKQAKMFKNINSLNLLKTIN